MPAVGSFEGADLTFTEPFHPAFARGSQWVDGLGDLAGAPRAQTPADANGRPRMVRGRSDRVRVIVGLIARWLVGELNGEALGSQDFRR